MLKVSLLPVSHSFSSIFHVKQINLEDTKFSSKNIAIELSVGESSTIFVHL